MPSPSLRRFRPMLEVLEARLTPDGTVTGSLLNGVWTLTGDAFPNYLSVNSTGVAGAFTVSGVGTTFSGVTSPTGVKSIAIDLFAGADSVNFNENATPIKLKGSLTIDGGADDNSVGATGLTVKKDLSITNGTHAGTANISLADFSVGGNCTINNGAGTNSILIRGSLAGFSTIKGNVNITNGAGLDYVDFTDTNIGGSLIDDNGSGDGSFCGYFHFHNDTQTTRRAVIGGSVRVTFADGNGFTENGIRDTIIKKDVTFNNGTGSLDTSFDGDKVAQPVQIKGNLTIVGSGFNRARVGTQYLGTGLRVGKNMTMTLTTPAAPEFNNLYVKGNLHFFTT